MVEMGLGALSVALKKRGQTKSLGASDVSRTRRRRAGVARRRRGRRVGKGIGGGVRFGVEKGRSLVVRRRTSHLATHALTSLLCFRGCLGGGRRVRESNGAPGPR